MKLRRPTRKRHVAVPLFLLALLGLTAWINFPVMSNIFRRSTLRAESLTTLPEFVAGQRILILSPHPDDETLCCAGMIQQARAAGAQVYVVWVTGGDGFEFDAALLQHTLHPKGRHMRELGLQRVQEARNAVRVLGIPDDHLYFLGYPDGGLMSLFTTNFATPYFDPETGVSRVYLPQALSVGADYTGRALERDLRQVLNRSRPDLVLAPAPQDFHPDHHALSYIASRLMDERGQENQLRYWVVHGGLEWPIPKGLHENLPLTLPPRADKLPWKRTLLTPEQKAQKLRAINEYHTQTRVMGRFMRAFVRKNELLTESITPSSSPGNSPVNSAGSAQPAPALKFGP